MKSSLFRGLMTVLMVGVLAVPIAAFDVVANVVHAVVDEVVKFVEWTECTKGGCRSMSKPAPGYTENDRYYTADDIANHFREFKDQYSFDNTNPPTTALARLSSNPDQYSNVASVGTKAVSGPVVFPISQYASQLKKGDIYFSRSDTIGAKIGQYFTSWFHCGVFNNASLGDTFESQISGGVQESNIRRLDPAWCWSVKRLESRWLSSSQVAAAVDAGIVKYNGRAYFPRFFYSGMARNGFIKRWSDKWDSESMYCSKLVWRIFYDAGVDLDSDRTTSLVGDTYHSATTDDGRKNPNAWIGVSGDDIYYSNKLGYDIVLIGAENLVKPIWVN